MDDHFGTIYIMHLVDSALWYSGRYATGTPLVTRRRDEALRMPEAEARATLAASKGWNRGEWCIEEVGTDD